MGFWDKSLQIVKCLCDRGQQSIRQLAQQTGLSKSSVHRLQQARERRGGHPESWLWETEDGRQWLTRLVGATLYTFGLKSGVGMDTLHAFFARLHLATQVGCSPSALRRVIKTLEATILETAATWEKDGVAMGDGQEIIGAVDETFLERMVLILLDLKTGYVVLEETADDRSYATWQALVDQRLDALRAQVRYVVSDRAKALIQLAVKGLKCLSMPDFFHLVHDIVKSYSLALGQRLKQARQELQKAEDRLRRSPDGATRGRTGSGHASGGGATRGGEALGSETPGVSAAARNPLSHAPSFCDRRCRSPDLCQGGSPLAGAR
jgi:DNA-binding Lrp family transcriptional regulator